jgi:group I intron endonuclease
MSTLSLPRTSGIYLITCTANHKIYIGSTSNLRKRHHDHFADLKRGAHSNRHMQSACNKYGIDVFTFDVLEYVMPFIRIEREQYWLDKLKPYNHDIGFNVAIRARGDKLSAEHRANISKSNMGHPVSAESRAKMSASKKGKPLSLQARKGNIAFMTGRAIAPEIRSKLANSKSIIEWLVIAPNGGTQIIKNLKQFCRDNGLNSGHMFQVGRRNREHHKGWKCQKILPP